MRKSARKKKESIEWKDAEGALKSEWKSKLKRVWVENLSKWVATEFVASKHPDTQCLNEMWTGSDGLSEGTMRIEKEADDDDNEVEEDKDEEDM